MTKSALFELKIPLKKVPPAIQNLDEELSIFIDPRTDEEIPYRILKKSVDARKKNDISLLYKVETYPESQPTSADYPIVNSSKIEHPVIVGAGPAGLLAAWQLARAGAKPIVIERGQPVEQRTEDIRTLHETHQINPNSNYLYGEGGAGTYSDGKLYTRIKDPRCDLVLKLFAEHGAPEEILWTQRPHVGSDLLPGMIASIRNQIIEMGGTFRWGAECKKILTEGNCCTGIQLADGEKIEAPAVVLAIGHSARELILNLTEMGVEHTLKNIQMGCRVEHPQDFVNQMQYGMKVFPQYLPIPEYHIVSRPQSDRILTATSFCMCPGGEIIPATDRSGLLCTNGMSPYKRNLPYANAAIIAALPQNFNSAKQAFDFVEKIERTTFMMGSGGFMAPAQDVKGFMRGEATLSKSNNTSYEMGIIQAQLSQIPPTPIYNALCTAFTHFEKLAKGFIQQGKVIGMETRISSPVRFMRNMETLSSSSHANLWLAGEGAGCAGGIMSSAVDGLKIAEQILVQ